MAKKSKASLVYFATGFFFLFSPVVANSFLSTDPSFSTNLNKIAYIVYGLSFFMFILAFVRPKYFLLSLTPVALLVPIELYVIFTLKSLVHEGNINSILNTNLDESTELLLSNIFPASIFLLLFYLYIILFIKMNSTFILSKKNKIRLLSLSCIIQMLVVSREIYRVEVQYGNIPLTEKIDDILYLYRIKMLKTFPVSWIANLYLYSKSIIASNNYDYKIKKFNFGAKEVSNKNEKKIIVMIIGETARRYNFSLYGYERKTNPFLEKEENIIVMNNVEAAYNLTVDSYSIFLSRAGNIYSKLHLSEPSLLQAYKEAGFYTVYINSQKFRYRSIYDLYSKQADYFVEANKNINRYQNLTLTDEDATEKFDEILKNNNHDKIFIVIHSIGSHIQYKCRYPESFEIFKPTTGATSIKNKQELVNAYDNSILFTDYFLYRIISILKTKDQHMSLMMYASDHGENIYDDNNNFFGHGGVVMSKYEKEIPMIIWYSSLYMEHSKEKIDMIRKHVNSTVSTRNFFHSMLDMSGIYIDNQTYEKSISNANFESSQTVLLDK